MCILCLFWFIKEMVFLKSFFKRDSNVFQSHDFQKEGVLSSSSYHVCAQCIERCYYVECAYFFILIIKRNVIFLKSCFLRNKLMFLEFVIFKRSGTKLFMFTIVCTMYLKVWLCRNVHTLLCLFNKRMEFDKRSLFFINNVIFHRKHDF